MSNPIEPTDPSEMQHFKWRPEGSIVKLKKTSQFDPECDPTLAVKRTYRPFTDPPSYEDRDLPVESHWASVNFVREDVNFAREDVNSVREEADHNKPLPPKPLPPTPAPEPFVPSKAKRSSTRYLPSFSRRASNISITESVRSRMSFGLFSRKNSVASNKPGSRRGSKFGAEVKEGLKNTKEGFKWMGMEPKTQDAHLYVKEADIAREVEQERRKDPTSRPKFQKYALAARIGNAVRRNSSQFEVHATDNIMLDATIAAHKQNRENIIKRNADTLKRQRLAVQTAMENGQNPPRSPDLASEPANSFDTTDRDNLVAEAEKQFNLQRQQLDPESYPALPRPQKSAIKFRDLIGKAKSRRRRTDSSEFGCAGIDGAVSNCTDPDCLAPTKKFLKKGGLCEKCYNYKKAKGQ